MSVTAQLLKHPKFDEETRKLARQVASTFEIEIFALEHQHKPGLNPTITAYSTPVWNEIEKIAKKSYKPPMPEWPSPFGTNFPPSVWSTWPSEPMGTEHMFPSFGKFCTYDEFVANCCSRFAERTCMPLDYSKARANFLTACFRKHGYNSLAHMNIANQLCKLLDRAKQQQTCVVHDCMCK